MRSISSSPAPGRPVPLHDDVPVLEARRRRLVQERDRDDPTKPDEADTRERGAWNPQGALDHSVISRAQLRPEHDPAAARAAAIEHQHPDGRGERERDEHRRDHGERERERHRVQVCRRQALGEEHRRDREQDDQRAVPERAPKLSDGLDDHRLQRDVDAVLGTPADRGDERHGAADRVVDDHRRGDEQAEHDERVQRVAERVEQDHGREQRERDRQRREEHRAEVEQQRAEREDPERRRDHEREREVVQGVARRSSRA